MTFDEVKAGAISDGRGTLVWSDDYLQACIFRHEGPHNIYGAWHNGYVMCDWPVFVRASSDDITYNHDGVIGIFDIDRSQRSLDTMIKRVQALAAEVAYGR